MKTNERRMYPKTWRRIRKRVKGRHRETCASYLDRAEKEVKSEDENEKL